MARRSKKKGTQIMATAEGERGTENLVPSGRFKRDGTPIMVKPREEWKEREPNPELARARFIVKVLQEIFEVPEDDIRVRQDAWGESRTVWFKLNGEKKSASTYRELRRELGFDW